VTRPLLTLAMLALATAEVSAQGKGRIEGAVRDETGGVLPGAVLALFGTAARTGVSGADGRYRFDSLPAGRYRLAVSLAGFAAEERPSLELESEAILEVPFTLVVALRGGEMTVTASRLETSVLDAPATVSVLSSQAIASSPAQNYGDLLRTVPGVNAIQTSVRDVNLSNREATFVLANSQLTLVDGRTLNLDFLGHVLWDLVPQSPADIEQIEVVRGPASVVWGASALTGVVNIITKSPREALGGSLALTGGLFGRACDRCSQSEIGSAYGASTTFAAAPSDRWSYKVSAGYFASDPLSRPTGQIPVVADPRVENPRCDTATGRGDCVGGASYPADGSEGSFGTHYENSPTRQPRLDLRADQELGAGGRLTYAAGIGGTQGIAHANLGPYELRRGSYLAYAQLNYVRRALRLSLYGNFVEGDAPNLLTFDPVTLAPLRLGFRTQTYHLDLGHSRIFGTRHVLSYGASARRNNFDITIAPGAPDRNELGVYVEDAVFFDKLRFSLGARLDKFGNLDDPVLSPRLAVVVKPWRSQSLRLSYNRAFRSPSMIENYLSQPISAPVDLSGLALIDPRLGPAVGEPFPLVIEAIGSELPLAGERQRRLKEESLTAYEVAYTGTFQNKVTVGLAFYVNKRDDTIRFSVLPPTRDPYTTASPPPGWVERGLPAGLVDVLAGLPPDLGGPIVFPRTGFTYLNLGPTRTSGVEASVDAALTREWSLYANYSHQSRPVILDPGAGQTRFPKSDLALPPANRFNLGVRWNGPRAFGSVSFSHSDGTFWSEVLTAQYFGYTDSYGMLGAAVGLKMAGGRLTVSLKGTNLANQTIQQEIFGDILRREVRAELRLAF